ncbi:MAG: stage 0 sporulation protein Spo0J [Candidatus Kapaibacteriales bacterium]
MSKKLEKGLGKGLGALIPSVKFSKDENGFDVPNDKNEKYELTKEVPISQIVKNPYQPRKHFDKESLEELTESIKIHGVIQPITVRIVENGFELIAGERRLRAATLAGLNKIPVNIIDIESKQKIIELALIENIQRHDLNPIEEALAYRQLINECGITQAEVATRVSKERSTVANLLRLLRLPERVQTYVADGDISVGHAKVLLGLEDENLCIDLAEQVAQKNISIKKLEELIKKASTASKQSEIRDNNEYEPYIRNIVNNLRGTFATDVRLKYGKDQKGSIEIKFYSDDDLNRILELINGVE